MNTIDNIYFAGKLSNTGFYISVGIVVFTVVFTIYKKSQKKPVSKIALFGLLIAFINFLIFRL